MKLGEPFGKDMKMEKGKLRKENTYRKEQESKQKAKKSRCFARTLVPDYRESLTIPSYTQHTIAEKKENTVSETNTTV